MILFYIKQNKTQLSHKEIGRFTLKHFQRKETFVQKVIQIFFKPKKCIRTLSRDFRPTFCFMNFELDARMNKLKYFRKNMVKFRQIIPKFRDVLHTQPTVGGHRRVRTSLASSDCS